MNKYLEAGKIRNAHGVNGAVIAESYCDNIKIFCSLKTFYVRDSSENDLRKLTVIKNQKYNDITALVQFEDFTVREQALNYKGFILYVDRNDLPELKKDSYFIADLIGLSVYNFDDKNIFYGKITDVMNYGASDIYEIKGRDGKVFLVPAVKEYVVKIDLEKGMYLRPIEGMFE